MRAGGRRVRPRRRRSSSTCRARRSGSAVRRTVRVLLETGATLHDHDRGRPGRRRARVDDVHSGLPGDVSAGDRILIDDGKVPLEVVAIDGPRVVTEVVEGGMVSDHKGINLPGVAVSVPAMSEKDIEDLRWALRLGVDLIALSFVRYAADIEAVHAIMDEVGVRLPVIAKIEKPQAVEHLEAIVEAFDGVMVARGDLGVELPLEQVPLVQKRAVAAGARGRPSRSSSRPRCSSR